MGLLDGLLGGALQDALAGGTARAHAPATGGGAVAALLPIVLAMLSERGAATQAAPPGGAGPLGNILGALLDGGGDGAGGLGGLLRRVEAAGFGREASSWVAAGPNLPLPTDAIGRIFGGDALARIAGEAGLSEAATADGLSQLIPEMVDRLTPEGRMPGPDPLGAGVDALRARLGL